MTAEEFLEEYPDSEQCFGDLEDMACKQCGNRESFRVELGTMATLYDNGLRDIDTSDWDRDSYCRCQVCDAAEDVRYFTIRGLDRLITQRREHPVREPQAEDQHFL